MLRFGLSNDGQKFTANKFDGFLSPAEQDINLSEDERLAVILDIETTGLLADKHEIIEIGARKVAFNKNSGKITTIGPSFESLQEPSEPLPELITKITGLTQSDLIGHSIEWSVFDDFIKDASILISHNAYFDRPFVDKHSKISQEKIWGCSLSQITWSEWFPSRSLESLALHNGFFYDSHRALKDVDALINLISLSNPHNEETSYLSLLLENAKKPTYWVYATNSPFESKDILKKRGYAWCPTKRVWKKRISENVIDEEKQFLAQNVYVDIEPAETIQKVALKDSFKSECNPS